MSTVIITAPLPAPPAPRHASSSVRRDIQGLRAAAVGIVVLYHLFPEMLTGGFVGVDVFFVISGFLITHHLITRPPRRPRDLANFWTRRLRRLLPASLTVLLVSALATRVVAPETQWENTARAVQASATYVMNWHLAEEAVDYSAEGEATTPVQHFWSLSVEEQFYLVWPLLIALLVAIAAWSGRRSIEAVRAGLVLVVIASLAYSVWYTSHDPAGAYFVTFTRVWELGAGGLLAAFLWRPAQRTSWVPQSSNMPTVAAGVGMVAIAWSAWSYSSATPFPGWHAAVPVTGAILVIASGDRLRPGSVVSLLAARPMQRLGDLSYGVYLWHWPLIVLLPYVSGGELGLLDAAAVLVVSWILAELTKRLIEDPVRTAPVVRLSRVYLAAALGMVLVFGIATVQLAEVAHREQLEEARVAAALKSADPCFGAAAMANRGDCSIPAEGPLVPTPAQAVNERYDLENTLLGNGDCWASAPAFETKSCEFGDPDADIHVAVVGNSHAAHWMAPIQQIAAYRGWRISTFFANRCALAPTLQEFDTAEWSRACGDWVGRTTAHIAAQDFDFIILSNRMSLFAAGQSEDTGGRQAYAAAYARLLGEWQRSGERVVAIVDTPWPGATVGSVPPCLEAHPEDYAACAGPRSSWVPDDPIVEAVRNIDDPKIRSVDLNHLICGPEQCPAVVGGVIVYSDHSHLTTTFARTVAPYLEQALKTALQSK